MPEASNPHDALTLLLVTAAVVLNQLGAVGREWLQEWRRSKKDGNDPGDSDAELLGAIRGLGEQVSTLSEQIREMPNSYSSCNWSAQAAEAFRTAAYHAKRNREILEEMRENQLRGGYECRWQRDEVLRDLSQGDSS